MVKIIGLMSGTSLDGLDMCYAGFELNDNKWEYTIFAAEAEEYPAEIKSKLAEAQNMSALEYALFNSDYGLYLGQRVKLFIDKHKISPD